MRSQQLGLSAFKLVSAEKEKRMWHWWALTMAFNWKRRGILRTVHKDLINENVIQSDKSMVDNGGSGSENAF